jgi:hypothetical protein
MLIQNRNCVLLTGILLLLLAFGCQHLVDEIPKVELSRSPEITFNLKNDTSGNLRVLAAQDAAKGPYYNLAPGGTLPIKFYLLRVGNLEETQYEWKKLVPGSETNMIITGDPKNISYITVQGEDGLIQMRTDQGRLWKLLLDVESCFETQSVVDEILITGPPDPISPTTVCE